MNETDPSAQLTNVRLFLFLIYNTLNFTFQIFSQVELAVHNVLLHTY